MPRTDKEQSIPENAAVAVATDAAGDELRIEKATGAGENDYVIAGTGEGTVWLETSGLAVEICRRAGSLYIGVHRRDKVMETPLDEIEVEILESFEKVFRHFSDIYQCSGDCSGSSDVCVCEFRFACSECGREVVAHGDEMHQYAEFKGKCQPCELGIN